ncbi:MAG: hypothetical protein ABL962_19435 [Fimbriimonadaceae bacterium]
MKDNDIRAALLTVLEKRKGDRSGNLQSTSVLGAAAELLGIRMNAAMEQALLTEFSELFRTGYLAWGLNLANPNPPFLHITERGLKSLEHVSADPGNPNGYLNRVASIANLNPIAKSYLEEAVNCYVAGHYKASAVMVGGASESVVLELRDAVSAKLGVLNQPIPKDLNDWRIARILQALKSVIDARIRNLPPDLKAEYESYWAAFTQQIRAVRNDAGHPTSVDPISHEAVHASLLLFPELLKLAAKLRQWVTDTMT